MKGNMWKIERTIKKIREIRERDRDRYTGIEKRVSERERERKTDRSS